MKTNWTQLEDIILKVGYWHFSAHIGGHQFPMKCWFGEECMKVHLKMFKFAKDKNDKTLTLYQY